MKRFLILGCLLIIGTFAFGQKKINRDPSYSVRNYKQPNKAVYARQHNLDKLVIFRQTVVVSNSEYKHRYNNAGLVVKSTLRTSKLKPSGNGPKHPLGL